MNIEQLSKMDDAALGKAFGYDKKLQEAKAGIAKMMALEGEARAKAEERVSRMFEPNVYPDEFKWIAEDSARSACRDAKEELCDCSPASIY